MKILLNRTIKDPRICFYCGKQSPLLTLAFSSDRSRGLFLRVGCGGRGGVCGGLVR